MFFKNCNGNVCNVFINFFYTCYILTFSAPAVDYVNEVPTTEHVAPPLLGQHTEEVLSDVLRLDQAEIDDLIRRGVISCASLK